MIVGEGVIDGHIIEEGFYVGVEEGLNVGVVEGGVDENGADVGFYYVWEALQSFVNFILHDRRGWIYTFGGSLTPIQ